METLKPTLLCLDDECDNLDALERIFKKKYNVLKVTSAEKAFEIAYRMRMELLYKCLVAPPSLLYESNEGGVKFLLAETIGKHITPYFGEFKWEWEFPKN